MAIAPTGTIYKSLIFDGKDSRAYGVYITGAGVYNAPERAVEMISIPGRNGSFALDGGRFENIEIEYPAGIFADNETDFAAAVSDFRNFLCSKVGYCRLTDGYNPGEYRMAVYKSGLEVDPAQLRAGEFSIKFECKPQRWLTSGETPIALSSGDTVNNPTLFPASPLIAADGYGEINFNGATMEILNNTIGTVDIYKGQKIVNGDRTTTTLTVEVDYSSFSNVINQGDTITGTFRTGANTMVDVPPYPNVWIAEINSVATGSKVQSLSFGVYKNFTMHAFPATTQSVTDTETRTIKLSNNVTYTLTATATLQNTPAGVISLTGSLTSDTDVSAYCVNRTSAVTLENVSAESTVPITGSITYIDLDIGEAYKIENDEFVPLNSSVVIPAELPQLAPGANVINFDNTITDFSITTRAWKI